MKLTWIALLTFAMAAGLAFAGSGAEPPRPLQNTNASSNEVNHQWIAEGEKRYRINCGRCHQPPHRFQRRVMATAVRHMRVRGMLTDDDMKYVLYYMTH